MNYCASVWASIPRFDVPSQYLKDSNTLSLPLLRSLGGYVQVSDFRDLSFILNEVKVNQFTDVNAYIPVNGAEAYVDKTYNDQRQIALQKN